MKKYFIAVTILALVMVLAVGCAGAPSPAPTPTGEEVNFRLWISDEVNAIDGFDELWVNITSIGVHQGGKSGGWIEPDGFEPVEVNLKELIGPNALVIWSGTLPEGEYNKVFIYVDKVTGILDGADGGEADVKLPSKKLQISKPFTISDSVVNFVYDITVVEAGKSGKYILQPQIAQSGAAQRFNDITPEREREREGQPEDELDLRLEGEPGLGMEVTLVVTDNGTPVEGAVVTVNDEEAGSTDADGRLTILLPDTPGEVEIEATLGDKSGELEIELEELGEEREWFEGTITAITEGEENASPWTMTLEGVDGEVTVYVIELEGTPAVGAWAEVEGVLTDSIIEEATAEIEGEE